MEALTLGLLEWWFPGRAAPFPPCLFEPLKWNYEDFYFWVCLDRARFRQGRASLHQQSLEALLPPFLLFQNFHFLLGSGPGPACPQWTVWNPTKIALPKSVASGAPSLYQVGDCFF